MKPLLGELIRDALFILVLGIPFVYIANCYFALPLWRQYQSRWFAKTTGRVLKAVAVTEYSDDSYEVSLKVRYRYLVDGVVYEGDRFNRGTALPPGVNKHRLAAELKRSPEVPVFYDRDDATIAVLDNRFLRYLFPIGFLPLAIYMLALAAGVSWFRRLRVYLAKETIDGLIVRRDSAHPTNRIVVRVDPKSPIHGASYGAGCLSLVALFVVLVAFVACNETIGLGIGIACLAVVGVATIYGAVQLQWDIMQGRYDLVIDAGKQTLSLPRLDTKEVGVIIPFDRLSSVAGDRKDAIVIFDYRNENERAVSKRLGGFSSSGAAVAVAVWIRAELAKLSVTVDDRNVGGPPLNQLDPQKPPNPSEGADQPA